jgi:hypothetical protein
MRCALQVNREVAARLMAQQQLADGDDPEAAETASKKRKAAAAAEAAAAATTLLSDDRFKAMFEDTDYAIDERSKDYKLLHPNVAAGSSKRGTAAADDDGEEEKVEVGEDALLNEHFQQILDEGLSEDEGSDEDLSDDVTSGDDSDMIGAGRQQQQHQQQQRKVKGHWQQLKRQQPDTGQGKPAKRWVCRSRACIPAHGRGGCLRQATVHSVAPCPARCAKYAWTTLRLCCAGEM